MDQRLAGLPEGSVRAMLASIRAQLTYVTEMLAAEGDGAADVAQRTDAPPLSLGVIAVREFEATDPQYCEVLCEVAYRAERR